MFQTPQAVLLFDMAKNLAYICKQLLAGKTPEQLGGVVCGRGCFKAAYKFDSPAGGFVIKESLQVGENGNGEAVKLPPRWIRDYGARQPRTYKTGKYIIQEFVTPAHKVKDFSSTPAGKVHSEMNRDKRAKLLDMHDGNVGVDSNGTLVVFDW